MHYIYLVVAILFEAFGMAALKASDGFTKTWPALGSLACFGMAVYLLSLILRVLPIGVVYAIWSGVGIVLVAMTGFVFFKQSLDTPAYIGIGLIVAGVLVLQLFSTAQA